MRLPVRRRPFLDRPGRCSACGTELLVGSEEELSASGWTVRGHAAICPSCEGAGWELSPELVAHRRRSRGETPEASAHSTEAGRSALRLRRPRPFLDRPGRCSACGTELLVGSEEELSASGWTVRGDAALCPSCKGEGWDLSPELVAHRGRSRDATPQATGQPAEAVWSRLGLGRLRPVVGLAALLAVGAAGVLAGASGGEADVKTTSASSGPIRITAPSGWERRPVRVRIPGLSPSLELVPRDQAEAGLVAGEVRSVDRPVDPELVVLGETVALEYRGLRLGGSEDRLNLYVVPTDRSDVGVACFARGSGAARLLDRCEGVAASLVLRDREGISPDAFRDSASSLRSTIAELRSARARGRARLSRARTTRAQASASRQLARAFSAAARTLLAAPASKHLYPDAFAALRKAKAAYTALASAARHNRRSGFYAARRDIGRAESALQGALRQARLTFGARRS